jgi:hypothetical protein
LDASVRPPTLVNKLLDRFFEPSAYCTQVLHLAERAAYNRIEAARAARRFPPIMIVSCIPSPAGLSDPAG